MRYLKKLGLFVPVLLAFLVCGMAQNASAQRYHHRPVVVRSHIYFGDPFWRPGFGWGYWHDPFYFERNQRRLDRDAVYDKRHKLAKDKAKYNADGYLTPKEQEKLAKDREKYDKAVERWNGER